MDPMMENAPTAAEAARDEGVAYRCACSRNEFGDWEPCGPCEAEAEASGENEPIDLYFGDLMRVDPDHFEFG